MPKSGALSSNLTVVFSKGTAADHRPAFWAGAVIPTQDVSDQQSGCVPSSPCAGVDTEGLTDATTGLNMCFHFPGLEQVLLPSQGHHNCALYMWDVWPEASAVFWLTFFFFFRLGPYGVTALLCSIWSLEEKTPPGFYFHWDILKSNLQLLFIIFPQASDASYQTRFVKTMENRHSQTPALCNWCVSIKANFNQTFFFFLICFEDENE